MGGGREILELLAGEDVDGNQVDLGVTVLSSLGGRHVDNLARAALDDDVTVLAQSRALHGEGQRRAGVGGLEGVIMLERDCQYACIVYSNWMVLMIVGCFGRGKGGRGHCVVCHPHLAMRGGNSRWPQTTKRNPRGAGQTSASAMMMDCIKESGPVLEKRRQRDVTMPKGRLQKKGRGLRGLVVYTWLR